MGKIEASVFVSPGPPESMVREVGKGQTDRKLGIAYPVLGSARI